MIKKSAEPSLRGGFRKALRVGITSKKNYYVNIKNNI